MALDIASAIDITDATRSFVLVPDTNSLWTRTIASLRLCSSQFETSWHELCKPADIRLCIPAIVFNERCYQVVNSLWSDYTKAAASLERIGLTLNRDMAAPGFTWDELRECVCARLEEQVRALPQAAVIETPFEAIGANQLREIAEASVWRRAPFKAGDKEQGFRDALILETVKAAVCRNPHSDVHFLCSDRRLAEAAETQLRGSKNFGVFEDFEQLDSFLTLARTRFNPEYLHAATSKAHEMFSVLWKHDKVEKYIEQKFKLETAWRYARSDEHPYSSILGGMMYARKEFGVFTFSRTVLMGVVGNDEFHWKTIVGFCAAYEHNRHALSIPGLLGPLGILSQTMNSAPADENNRLLLLAIEWQANVTDALQFELGPYDVFQIAEHWLEPGEQTSEVLNALIRAA